MPPGVGPLALVLAMPAVCGALDGSLATGATAATSAGGEEVAVVAVLGEAGPRLAGLFAAATAKNVRGTAALRGGGDVKDESAAAAAGDGGGGDGGDDDGSSRWGGAS